MKEPRLRDSRSSETNELYPINDFPEEVIRRIGRHFVYLKCVGRNDLSGNDWGDVFADAIGAKHLHSPLGLSDVTLGKMAWSMKTIKKDKPHTTKAGIRLIIGRNSTDFSYKLENPRKDPQKTGDYVLQIWNKRVLNAYERYTTLRTCVLIRSNDLTSFSLFEEDTRQFVPNAYRWELNKNDNLVGIDIETGKKTFAWQPSGPQFSIHTHIPKNAFKFKIKEPPQLDKEKTLRQINFSDEWVEIL